MCRRRLEAAIYRRCKPLVLQLNVSHGEFTTRFFEHAIQRVRALPPEAQDEYARVLLRLAGEDAGDVYQLTTEEDASLAKSLEQAECGEFASDEDVQAVWAKHGL